MPDLESRHSFLQLTKVVLDFPDPFFFFPPKKNRLKPETSGFEKEPFLFQEVHFQVPQATLCFLGSTWLVKNSNVSGDLLVDGSWFL